MTVFGRAVARLESVVSTPGIREIARNLGVAVATALVVGACQSSVVLQATESPEPTPTPTLATSSPSAVPSASCDPADALFALMFVGLSEAALTNAGIAPEEFFAALDGDREALKTYLKALDIPFDDAQLDAAMSANLGQRLFKQSLSDGSAAASGSEWLICE